MTNYSAKTVAQYIAAAPAEARSHLREIRAAVKSAVPKAKEGIHWGKPYYDQDGMLAGFDALKNHITFELWADELNSKERKALEGSDYKTGKRSFQINYDQKVPTASIKRLVKAQAKLNAAKAKRKND